MLRSYSTHAPEVPLCRALARIRVNPEPESIMVLFAAVAASSQLRLESRLASLIIDRLLLLTVPDLNRPIDVVPSADTEVRLAVLKLADRLAPFDARIYDCRVASADVGAGLAALVAFGRLGLAGAGLLPVRAEPEGFAGLDRFARCFSAGCVDVVLDFLGDVAGVAEAVEGVKVCFGLVARAVAAESFEEAVVRWDRAGVGKLGQGEDAEDGWDHGCDGRHGGMCFSDCR